MAKQSKVQKWNLNDLHPHPRQAELFGDMTDGELEFLAADIQQNGLERPVEIRPNGQIISGHQRVRAVRLLGLSKILVTIRHDLEELGECAIALRFVDDNLGHRQLDPFSVVLCVVERMQQFEHGSEWSARQKLVAEIQQRLDLGLRSINRYLALAETPRAVQEAFKRGRLSLVLAGRVARLPPDVRQQAASRISAGENPRTVVKELVDANGRTRLDYSPAFGPLISRLTELEKSLPGPTDQVTGQLNRESTLELLEQLVKKLTALKRRVKEKLRRDSLCESEGDRETKAWFDGLVVDQNGREQSADEPTTSPELVAKTRKQRT